MFSRRWLEIVVMVVIGLAFAAYGALRVPPGRIAVTAEGERMSLRRPGTALLPAELASEGNVPVAPADGSPASLRWSATCNLSGADAAFLRAAIATNPADVVATIATVTLARAWNDAETSAPEARLAACETALRQALESRGLAVSAIKVTGASPVAAP